MMIPESLREKYLLERENLYKLHEAIDDAVLNLISGSVASYSLGNRSVSYQDLDKLKSMLKEVEDRIDELEARLCGRSARNVSVSTFLDPAFIVPRRW